MTRQTAQWENVRQVRCREIRVDGSNWRHRSCMIELAIHHVSKSRDIAAVHTLPLGNQASKLVVNLVAGTDQLHRFPCTSWNDINGHVECRFTLVYNGCIFVSGDFIHCKGLTPVKTKRKRNNKIPLSTRTVCRNCREVTEEQTLSRSDWGTNTVACSGSAGPHKWLYPLIYGYLLSQYAYALFCLPQSVACFS